MHIDKIDKNFAAEPIEYEGLEIYSAKDSRFQLYGLYDPYNTEGYMRMPDAVAMEVNECARQLYKNTTGGRIRFRTDSKRVFVRSILPVLIRFDHMPRTGVSCFDLYVNGEYYNSFRHKCIDGEKESHIYDSKLSFKTKEMRDILIHFPLYNEVEEVYIGVDEGSTIKHAEEYSHTKPIVCYGSSITQGACASHPGNAYANLLALKYDTDILNLGFSSGARGEIPMMEYLAGLDMGVLVYDYDHNSPTEELAVNHQRGYRIIREKQPDLPIIMITAADRNMALPERKAIIRSTYENALANGDKNVYFIDGEDIYKPVGRSHCTVDAAHPNDVGFLLMADAIGNVLKKIGY